MSEASVLYERDYSVLAEEEQRERRAHSLRGKYVIVCKGIKSGKFVYLQDQTIDAGGWWTQFLGNAKAFDTFEEADKKAKSFKYNNPKAVLCT